VNHLSCGRRYSSIYEIIFFLPVVLTAQNPGNSRNKLDSSYTMINDFGKLERKVKFHG
jgi:hypothetical protein